MTPEQTAVSVGVYAVYVGMPIIGLVLIGAAVFKLRKVFVKTPDQERR